MGKQNSIDLDNFLNEIIGKGRKFKLYNRTWTLKPEIPAELMLKIQSDDEVTSEQELVLFRTLLEPADQFDELLALGLGPKAFEVIIRVALGVYSGIDPEVVLQQIRDEQSGEAEKKEEPDTST